MLKRAFFLLCCLVLLVGCSSMKTDNKVKNNAAKNQVPNTENTLVDSNEDVESEEVENTEYNVSGKIIVIDAGHGISNINHQEPMAPGSTVTKNAFVSGTRGVNQTEEELNLSVALKLQETLKKMGTQVSMTRTTHETDMSNVDRAQMANDLNADVCIRIHADGNNNSSVNGVSVLVPGATYIKDQTLLDKSRRFGECILEEFVANTGANNRGIVVRNDLTGFNWSKVPVILVEMGFMTNPEEDRLMESEEYQEKMAQGIANGIERYFKEK